jgi:hypothetical protein
VTTFGSWVGVPSAKSGTWLKQGRDFWRDGLILIGFKILLSGLFQ